MTKTIENKELKVYDTYCEAFKGICCRVIVTAEDKETVRRAAYDATSTPGTVIGRVEGGIEAWLGKNETPDGNEGAILQFWYNTNDFEKFDGKIFSNCVKKGDGILSNPNLYNTAITRYLSLEIFIFLELSSVNNVWTKCISKS